MPHSKNSKNEEHSSRDTYIYKSDLEDIDFALYKFIDERLDISTSSNKGFKKVPVIWGAAERAHSIKNNEIERSEMGMANLPLIVVEKSTIKKATSEKIAIPYAMADPRGDLKGGAITVNRVIQQNKTSNFANADAYRRKGQAYAPLFRRRDYNLIGKGESKNNKIVYETITIPLPIYVEVTYNIHLRTEYQEQMNDLLTPFVRVSNAHTRVILTHNYNEYEAFIGTDYGVSNKTINYESNERMYEAKIAIEVLGYLIGDGKNEKRPRVVRRENAVQVRFARERVITGDDEDGEFRF